MTTTAEEAAQIRPARNRVGRDTLAGLTPASVEGPTRLVELTPAVVDEVAVLLSRIAGKGGVVDFGAYIDQHRLQAAAVRIVAQSAERRSHIVVMRADGRIVGMVVIEAGACDYKVHRADLNWFMVDPDHQSGGLGRTLLLGAVEIARQLGHEQLYVSARAGSGLPEFYQRHGWRKVGSLPGGWRLAGVGDFDEVLLFLPVSPA